MRSWGCIRILKTTQSGQLTLTKGIPHSLSHSAKEEEKKRRGKRRGKTLSAIMFFFSTNCLTFLETAEHPSANRKKQINFIYLALVCNFKLSLSQTLVFIPCTLLFSFLTPLKGTEKQPAGTSLPPGVNPQQKEISVSTKMKAQTFSKKEGTVVTVIKIPSLQCCNLRQITVQTKCFCTSSFLPSLSASPHNLLHFSKKAEINITHRETHKLEKCESSGNIKRTRENSAHKISKKILCAINMDSFP